MTFEQVKSQDQAYILHTYGRVDAALVKGRNARAWDVDGKEYIDFTAGIGVNALGYCDPEWSAAVAGQAGKIQHMCNYYYCPENTALAQELSQASGMAKAFFCNSGAEANECAVKIARKYGEKRGAYRIVTLENSFHGRTLTTLAATGQEGFHREFLPLTEGFLYAQAGDLAGIQALLDGSVCAVMLEMVQGEGGVIPMDEGFVQGLAQLCREKDVLLLIDEVQTGIGRTGRFFAYQGYGVQPDVVTCAKGIAGGLPMGACLVSERLGDILQPGQNGSTFGGNPIASAAARVVVRRVSEPDFLQSVAEKGAYFREKLEAMPQVEYVRGRGLMLGVKLKEKDAHDVLVQCAKAGLLILTAKELVRFLPPLTITQEDIDQGLAIFQQVLAQ
ncbi:MAG TPA: aspartate aminotransferase family protein [Candidatus Acutalibacter ornithocaccae]|uniref:Acetylornithine aminotransferase n=1 Tax=Candidatus Acutalibacter ornithocaccae TaxID=2838416 RepID=A0A9D2RYP9_9FIRM|nr:aspartate aminotransferase family protein [Candidatus Acutalibacter ornithocaccae]